MGVSVGAPEFCCSREGAILRPVSAACARVWGWGYGEDPGAGLEWGWGGLPGLGMLRPPGTQFPPFWGWVREAGRRGRARL